MSKLRFITLAAVAIAMGAPAAAQVYDTNLSGLNEVPPNTSPASGYGTLVLSDNGRFAQVDINFTGLTAPLVAGHAHCCALPGFNAGVAIDFAPPALSSGTFSQLFDLSLATTYTTGFLNGSGGTAALAQARFLEALDAGSVYFNLHTSNFPGGEIRGNLGAVPEPASWAMMIGGFGMVGGALRRRRLQPLAA